MAEQPEPDLPDMTFEEMLEMSNEEVDRLLIHYQEYKKEREQFQRNAFIELPKLPPLVLDCIHFLRLNDGLKSEGIFRVNGDSHSVEAIKTAYLSNTDLNDVLLSVEQDLKLRNYDVATALKSYFRLLQSPLVPYDNYEGMKKAINNPNLDQLTGIRAEIAKIPEPNLSVFAYTMIFFQDICAMHETNKMSPNNMATCLTMSITRFRETGAGDAYFTAMVEVGVSTKIIALMLSSVDFTEFITPQKYFEFFKATSYRQRKLPRTLEDFMKIPEYEKFKARYHEDMRKLIGPPRIPRRTKKKNRYL